MSKMICKKFDLLLCETEFAYKISVEGKMRWLPKSQVVLYKISKEVEIPDWLFEKHFGCQCVYAPMSVADICNQTISRRRRKNGKVPC